MPERPLSLGEIEAAFHDAMCRAGITPSNRSAVAADGKLHRFHVDGDKPRTRNGWCVLYADGLPAGEFGTWRDGGASHTWHAAGARDLSASEQAELRARLKAASEARTKEREAEQAKARAKADTLWQQAGRVSASHAYIKRKGIKPYGIRQLRDQLLVPLRDTSGTLHGLQFIQPKGDKKFGTGTAKAGRYHSIGRPTARGVLGIVEGFATGATVHELTGWPVAVAFDAGNLKPVAQALRAKFPDARLLILADNDHTTAGNPGMTKAREAAEVVDAAVVAPRFNADEPGSDWNDYAAAQGAEAARAALLGALDTAPTDASTPPATDTAQDKPKPSPPPHIDRKRPSRDGYPAGFTVDDEAVWFRGFNKAGDELEAPYRVCPPLRVLAYLRDTEQENWGLLIEFEDKDQHTHRWALPWRLFSGSGEEMRAELLRQGFFVPPSSRARNLFVEYLAQAKAKQHARSVERTGWHGTAAGRVFVMPDRTIGDGPEPVFFQSESLRDRIYRQAGELSDWRSDVADLCRGNSRLQFVVSMAFASMLLDALGEESGGVHLRGGSSTGKTTALRVAAEHAGAPLTTPWRLWPSPITMRC